MALSRLSDTEHLQRLAGPSWWQCEGLIKAFEEAWRRGEHPNISDYLRLEGPARSALLVELAHVDLELRIKSGAATHVESYLSAYPELAADRRATIDLIAAEYELRRQRGDADLDEFARRFPEHVDNLRARLLIGARDTIAAAPLESVVEPAPWPEVPGYELLEELGRGGMGVVYRAREPSLGRQVALKFLPAEYAADADRLDRFRREARTASALNHPHICTVHALGEHAGRPFIVMEFVEGITLHGLAERQPSPAEVSAVVAQVATALAAAHAAGVVHRDIKPENAMIRPDGYVKVLDFGLARRLPTLPAPERGDGRGTDPGALIGTAAYMSPEQARGRPADSASDLFSLGIVLYELVAGRHPFEADSPLGILHAITAAHPVPAATVNPAVPPALDGLIMAMLQKDPRLRPTALEVADALETVGHAPVRPMPPTAPTRPIVPREPELNTLRFALAEADAGRGTIVCLAGEPGIGKTSLIDDFLAAVTDSGRSALVARGHCSERLAGAEAYHAILDALGNLLRSPAGPTVARVMQVVAPTWYAQLVPAAGGAAPANSQPAMLREFINLLREASRHGPTVLVLDDVHWADVPTVDLLAHFGRACRDLRALVVVAYRPTELLLGPHPFHRARLDLQGRGVCVELALGGLGPEDLVRYLDLAFSGHDLPPEFASLVHARTEGNPLFMADLLRDLCDRGVLAERDGRWTLAQRVPDLRHDLPESIRGTIARKLERLSDGDRRLLAAAAVQGAEFDAAVVAEAVGRDAADVEERLHHLDRVHGLIRRNREHEFPDRTLTVRYCFAHGLYQEALHAELTPARRASLSVAVARALDGHHGDDHPAVSADLACLYETGRDFARAARHCLRAAQTAAQVYAHHEAAGFAQRGIRALEALPESGARASLELPLQTALGLQLQVTDGYAAPAATTAYVRARELCQAVLGDPPLFPILWGLWLAAKVRSDLAQAETFANELRALARRLNDPALMLQAEQAQAVTHLCRGDPAATVRHMTQAAAVYDPDRHRSHSFQFGQDPGVACQAFGAIALWLLGRASDAVYRSEQAVLLSRSLAQPSSQALALHFAAVLHQLRRDGPAARRCAEAAGAIAVDHGFSFWQAGADVLRGWAEVATGDVANGLPRLLHGLKDWESTGSVTYRTYYLGLLAESLAGNGHDGAARVIVAEALELVAQTGEGLYEAELYRLRGDLQRVADDVRRAVDVARRQGAVAFELRAALSLSRLGTADAHEVLTAAVSRFPVGAETPDLKTARDVLLLGGHRAE